MLGIKGKVDKETCIGCGLCADLSPEVFHMDDDGKAVAHQDEISEDLLSSAMEAKEQCPVTAITIE